MISEIDLRDWEKVNIEQFKKTVQYQYDWESLPDGLYAEMIDFANQVEAIMKKQVAQKAALFQPAKTGRADIKGLIPQDDGCGWG